MASSQQRIPLYTHTSIAEAFRQLISHAIALAFVSSIIWFVTGVFLFGLVTVMIFADVIKLLTGQLRPIFLEVCKVNTTLCAINGNGGGDELCTNKDAMEIRHAR